MRKVSVTIHACLAVFLLLPMAERAAAADVSPKPEVAANVAKFRTFAFVQGDPQQAGVVADKQVRHRLERMVTSQLMAKGYAPAAPGQAAELGVNLAGKVVPGQQVLVVGNPTPYSYYRGRIEPGGTESVDYREGTVHVDILDLRQSKLLWETQISEKLTAGYSEENWKKVERALGEAFKSLPARR